MRRLVFQGLVTAVLFVAWQWLAGAAGPAAETQGPGKQESPEAYYGRMRFQLAEANLRRVRRMNQRVAGAVPSEIVLEYQQDVEVARTRWQDAMRGGSGDPFQGWLRRAEAMVRSAEMQWKNAMAANQRVPGTVDPTDVEYLRLRYEVARLQRDRGQSLVDKPLDAQLAWQFSLLDDQVQRLNEEVLRRPPTGIAYPRWLY